MKRVLIALTLATAILGTTMMLNGRTAAANPPPLAPVDQRANFVEVDKGDREMRLLRDGEVIRRYQVSLGFAPEGDKEREGDGNLRREERAELSISLRSG